MPNYTMWTMGGLSPGFGEWYVGGQAALLYMIIQKAGEISRAANYVMIGLGASVGPKGGISIAQGPQSPSEFFSPIEQADLFGGSVRIIETGIQLGVFNAGYSDMQWLSGLAQGTKCTSSGLGMCVGLSLAVGASTTAMLKFLGWKSLIADSTPQYQEPVRAHTDRMGRVLQQ
jgi:hypothetical protein